MTSQLNEQLRAYMRDIAAKGGSQKTAAQQKARRENAAKATAARKKVKEISRAALDNMSGSC